MGEKRRWVSTSQEAPKAKSGFSAIETVQGKIDQILPTYMEYKLGEKTEVFQVVMVDTVVLSMFPDEQGNEQKPMELKEGRYTFNYGLKVSDMSGWVQAFLKTAEATGFVIPDGMAEIEIGVPIIGGDVGSGKVVMLKKQPTLLVSPQTGEVVKDRDGRDMAVNNFVFVGGEPKDVDPDDLMDVVVGNTPAKVKRDLLMDKRVKGNKALVDKVKDGSLIEEMLVEVVDGVYQALE